MRKSKLESMATASLSKNRSSQILLALAVVYFLFLLAQFPPITTTRSSSSATGAGSSGDPLRSEEAIEGKFSPRRPRHVLQKSSSPSPKSAAPPRRLPYVSGLKFNEYGADTSTHNFSELHKSAKRAWNLGRKLFHELNNLNSSSLTAVSDEISMKSKEKESCPHSITLTGDEFKAKGRMIMLPCGLTLGSHITLVARPLAAHVEFDPKITMRTDGDQGVMVSQFMMELQGLKIVDGEEPPRILHFNPRLKGDWSGRPVIEQNTCFRMQWNTAQRCEGWRSNADEETGKAC